MEPNTEGAGAEVLDVVSTMNLAQATDNGAYRPDLGRPGVLFPLADVLRTYQPPPAKVTKGDRIELACVQVREKLKQHGRDMTFSDLCVATAIDRIILKHAMLKMSRDGRVKRLGRWGSYRYAV